MKKLLLGLGLVSVLSTTQVWPAAQVQSKAKTGLNISVKDLFDLLAKKNMMREYEELSDVFNNLAAKEIEEAMKAMDSVPEADA